MSKDWTYEELSDKFGKVSLQSAKKTMLIRKLKKHIKLALDFLASPDEVDEDANNVQLAFDELNQALKESEEEK